MWSPTSNNDNLNIAFMLAKSPWKTATEILCDLPDLKKFNNVGTLDFTKYAIEEAGYRHIDCAYMYHNEEEIGKAIKETIENGVVKRDDLFITTKCWNSFHSRAKVMQCLKESLSKLDLEYVDLYLIHWPFGFKENAGNVPKNDDGSIALSDIDFIETWQGMEDCFNAGLVKSIGISNFNSQQIKRILSEGKVKPVMNQVECHPYLNQAKLIEFCKNHEILVTAYFALGSPGNPHRLPDEPLPLQDSKINELAKNHNKSAAQVLIRYQVQRGVVVIPKSVTPARILSNIQVFDFELNADEMQAIDALDRQYRYATCDFCKDHKCYPHGIPF